MGKKKLRFEDPQLNALVRSLKPMTGVPVGNPGVNYGGYQPLNEKKFVPNFTSSQRLALAHNDITPEQAVTSQKVLDILKEVEGQNQAIRNMGGTPEDNSHRHGLLSRTLDIIQRPIYAMAEGAKEVAESATSGEGFLKGLEAFGHGALQGIEGKEKTDFIQVLQEAQDVRSAKSTGMSGKEAVEFAKSHPGSGGEISTLQKIAGFGLDVIGDPLTYTGIGLVSKGAKAAELVSDADKALQTVKAAEKLSPGARDLITGAHFASGKLSKKAAIAAEGRVGDIASKVAKAEGTATYDKVIGEGLKNQAKWGIDETQPVNDLELMHLAKTAKANREQEVMSNILNHYNKVVAENIDRKIGIGFMGSPKLAIPGIPNVELLAAATKGALTRVDPVAKGMRAFSKRFQTVAKAFPELHEAKLQAFDFGMTRIRLRGRVMRKYLNPLGKNGRTEAWAAFLHGHPSNQLIKLDDGSTVEASKWIADRVNPIKLSVLENGWKPADFKPWLPPGLEFKVTKIVRDGKKIDDPEWLINSLKDWNVKDGGKALWFLESSFEQTAAYKSMLGSMGDTFGATLGETHTAEQLSLFNGLKEKGWTAPKGVPELESHVFPPETANYISQISKLMKDEKNWSNFWRGWAKIQQPIKFLLTLPNPSFHMHNAVGDMFINHLDNVSPFSYAKSAKLMSHRSKWFETYNPAENRNPLLAVEGNPLKIARETTGPDDKTFLKNPGLRSADGKVYKHISQAEIYAGYNKFGLRQNYATDLGFTETSPVGALRGMVDKITSASEAREDYFRMAHFIHLIKTNPSKVRSLEEAMNFAARRVRETHFDYTDFTKFEKEVMSQLIPFYKWTRKALPLMAQVLITQPGKAALIPKGLRAMAALTGNIDMQTNDVLPNLQGAIVPNWMMNAGYVPVGDWFGSGNQSFGYLPNPMTDFFTQQFGGIQTGDPSGIKDVMFGSSSPFIKDLYELLSNESTFTGAKIIRNDPGSPSKVDQLLNYLGSQIPATNVANQYFRKGRVDTGFNWATGLSIHEDDEARQIGELLRQRDVGRAIERVLRYQQQQQNAGR